MTFLKSDYLTSARKTKQIRSKTTTDSSVKWKMIYMHARLTWCKESSALVLQAELRLRASFIKNTWTKDSKQVGDFSLFLSPVVLSFLLGNALIRTGDDGK